jgi:hypothetical protein
MASLVRGRLGVSGVVAVGVALIVTLVGCGGSERSPVVMAVQKFADEYDTAVRSGEVDYRIAHLHPAVLARYGEDQCRTFLATLRDRTRRTKVESIGKREPFEYASANVSITIPGTLPVQVKQTLWGKTVERHIHVAFVDGKYSYFIDCGTRTGPQ